jgi:hypothetical protein
VNKIFPHTKDGTMTKFADRRYLARFLFWYRVRREGGCGIVRALRSARFAAGNTAPASFGPKDYH